MNYLLLLKTLVAAVKEIESLMPQSAGKDKFDAAIALVEGVVGDVQALLPQLTPIVSLVVAGLNAAGIFKKSAPAAA